MNDVLILRCWKVDCHRLYKWKSKDVGSMHFGSAGNTECPYCHTPPRLCDLFPGRDPDNEPEQTK